MENFKTIQKSAVSLNLYPKIIFTSTLHVVSDVFKIWVSGRVKKGSKLILSDHGFYLEDEIDFNLWKKIAYKYVKWNLTKKKNCYQLPPNILLGRKKLDVVKNNNNFLIVLNSEPFYLKSFNFSKQPLAVYKNMKKFVHFFDKTKKKIFILDLILQNLIGVLIKTFQTILEKNKSIIIRIFFSQSGTIS